MRNGAVVRAPPTFPPIMWSVRDSMLPGFPRTQNAVEAWHRRWENIIGGAHIGLYNIIEELQKEEQQVNNEIECILRGEQTIT